MQQQIVTEYSNQLHQLLVCVSKHLYLGRDGKVKYQKKAMRVNLKNCGQSRKEHLVYYILRDHFSGSFAFRIATTKKLIPVADFLHYAWSEEAGEEKFIWGMPDAVFIPRMIAGDGLFARLDSLSVNGLNPPCGFAAGIRIVRIIEENMCFLMRNSTEQSLAGINKLRSKAYKHLLNASGRDNAFFRWRNNLPSPNHPRMVPPYPHFISLFYSTAPGAGLALAEQGRLEAVRAEQPNPARPKAFSGYPSFCRDKLNEARELIYEAWGEPNRQKSLILARQALHISPYCTDAYNLLAEQSKSLAERQYLFEQGVKAGRIAWGDLFLRRYAGHFQGYRNILPYMRALAGWAECLWKNGQRAEAIQNFRELLRLNPRDHHGIHRILVNCLLAEGMDAEAARLLAEYQESSCFTLYSRALLSFRRFGPGNSAVHLQAACKANRSVPSYLLGLKHIPCAKPYFNQPGSEEEAVVYAADACEVWRKTPGALEWLAGGIENLPIKNRFQPTDHPRPDLTLYTSLLV